MPLLTVVPPPPMTQLVSIEFLPLVIIQNLDQDVDPPIQTLAENLKRFKTQRFKKEIKQYSFKSL